MAKIARSLDDIEKLVKKAHQTPKEQLKEVRDRLQYLNIKKGFTNLEYYNKDGTTAKKPEQEAYKTLKEAEKILLEEIEKEENKKELDQIKLNDKLEKQIKKEIKEQLFNNLHHNFKISNGQYLRAYEIMHDPEVIEDEAKELTKIYGSGFNDYILSIYIKILEEVFKIYKYNADLQAKAEKASSEATQRRLKKGIKKDLAVIGILKLAHKKKNYRR